MAKSMQQTVCLEILFITILMWASMWGVIDMLVDRIQDTKNKLVFYGMLFLFAVILIGITPGLTTCRVL